MQKRYSWTEIHQFLNVTKINNYYKTKISFLKEFTFEKQYEHINVHFKEKTNKKYLLTNK